MVPYADVIEVRPQNIEYNHPHRTRHRTTNSWRCLRFSVCNGDALTSKSNGLAQRLDMSLPMSGNESYSPKVNKELKVNKQLKENNNGVTKSLALQTSGVCVSGKYKFQRGRAFGGQNSLR